ncbi:hypothetical protein ACFL4X_00940 [Gemmatimonadota bacterium]
MIARGMEIIDIEPVGYANFLNLIAGISGSVPRAVLWHEDGVALRMTLGGEMADLGGSHCSRRPRERSPASLQAVGPGQAGGGYRPARLQRNVQHAKPDAPAG